ncbi:MAG: DUF29 domain-containing protein [Xenococcus sp. (in: cyanobacteria)]
MSNPIARSQKQENKYNLYERDYHLWLIHTAKLVAENRFAEIDIVSLAEEIEDMGRSEKRAIRSNLRVLLVHLLKYKYQPDKRSNSWRATIREHRLRIKEAFQDSPSLKRYFDEVFDECYHNARASAADETGLEIATFNTQCPFSKVEVLDSDFLPEAFE